MTDRIELKGIEVVARHGVLPQERIEPQPFLVDVTIFTDLRGAGRSDRITDTIDYGRVAQTVHEIAGKESHQLIERVAERVAEAILEEGRVERVLVTVHKPEAPIPVEFADVAVTIDRSR